jgi:hypothetical protein
VKLKCEVRLSLTASNARPAHSCVVFTLQVLSVMTTTYRRGDNNQMRRNELAETNSYISQKGTRHTLAIQAKTKNNRSKKVISQFRRANHFLPSFCTTPLRKPSKKSFCSVGVAFPPDPVYIPVPLPLLLPSLTTLPSLDFETCSKSLP